MKSFRTISPEFFSAFLVSAMVLTVCSGLVSQTQTMLPFMNAGPDSGFAQMDFAQMYMDTSTREQLKNQEQVEQRKHLVETGQISALDLGASNKALEEYNRAATLMKQQDAKAALLHLQKAVSAYPKFVAAHNTLGLAYLELGDSHAKQEFEEAARLDPKFPGSFLHLGMLALSRNDFVEADSNLEKAAALTPNDPKTLAALAFAENGNHKYAQALQTADRVHTLEHRDFASVHLCRRSGGHGFAKLRSDGTRKLSGKFPCFRRSSLRWEELFISGAGFVCVLRAHTNCRAGARACSSRDYSFCLSRWPRR